MLTRDTKLAGWVARELEQFRKTYMDEHGIASVQQFASLVGVSKRHIYQLEKGVSSPTVETLSQILKTCNSSLVEFFCKMASRAQLAEIDNASAVEREWITTLISGLSHPKTRRHVEDAARNVRELLSLLGGQ